MGYTTKEMWDEDQSVPFDTKPFVDLTLSEKRAAFFLGINVIDKKLNIWWEDTDAETKSAALAVGFTKETWDDDWRIQDFPIEHKHWKELTDEQRAGASHFGYTRITWDETGETEFDDDDLPAPKLPPPPKESKEENNDGEESSGSESEEDEEEDVQIDEAAKAAKKEEKKKKKKSKKRFAASEFFGGESGSDFDDHNHKLIQKVVLRGGLTLDAIELTYEMGKTTKHGGNGGKEHSLELGKNEYINEVVVRHANLVQSLKFITNKGNEVVAGGRGRPILDSRGEETTVKAPPGMKLCGIMGRDGKLVDAIAFRWGSV